MADDVASSVTINDLPEPEEISSQVRLFADDTALLIVSFFYKMPKSFLNGIDNKMIS